MVLAGGGGGGGGDQPVSRSGVAVSNLELQIDIQAWVSCVSWCAGFEFRVTRRAAIELDPQHADAKYFLALQVRVNMIIVAI